MLEYIDTRLVIRPNASMSWLQAKHVIAWTVAAELGIGVYFVLQGLWPILPFCVVGVAAFAAALVASVRKNGYREVLSFNRGEIRVEFGMVEQGIASTVTLQREQTRVLLERGPYRSSPASLTLSCCGQRVEIARCTTDEERAALSQRIRQLIHPGWVPPTPAAEEQPPQWGRI